MTTRFIILMPWGRVGSNLLLSILRQSPIEVRRDNEGLTSITDAQKQLAALEQIYADDPANPVAFIGSKQSVRAIKDLSAVAKFLRDNDIKIIRLRRDNLVKTAISQIRAEIYAQQTGLWAVTREGTPLGATEIDFVMLQRRLTIISESNIALLGAFRSTDVLDLEYEELNLHMRRTAEKVFDYLGLPHYAFKERFLKATPDDPSAVVTNYAEIRERLAGTLYASMLE